MVIVLTFVIAVIGGIQAVIYRQQKRIMESPNSQTGELIDAAKVNARAAKGSAEAAAKSAQASRDFADTAGDINESIESAVAKLNAQAGAMQNLAGLTQKSIDNASRISEEDRRPWVGIQEIQCIKCSIVNGVMSIGGVDAVLTNSGRTPAIDVLVKNGMALNVAESTTMPDPSGMEEVDEISSPGMPQVAEDFKKSVAIHQERSALPPSGIRVVGIGPSMQVDKNDAFRTDKRSYLYGKIFYTDTSAKHVKHTTTFCVVNYFGTYTNWVFCPTGNNME